MNAPEIVRPDYAVLLAHLEGAAFLLGARDRRWRLDDVMWPHVLIYVSADARQGAPAEYLFRFECSGYPRVAATASLWDKATNGIPPTARWPGGRFRVPSVFRPDWKGGSALYLPCDRVSIEGHDAWRTKHQAQLWSEKLGIVRYLEVISELLNSSDYSGLRSA
jgi:hypothetical protein